MKQKNLAALLLALPLFFLTACGGGGPDLTQVFSPPLGEPSSIVRGIFDRQPASTTCRTDGSQLSIMQNISQVWMKGGFDYGQQASWVGWELSGWVDSENAVRFTIEGETETLTCLAALLEPIFQGTCTTEAGVSCDFVFSRTTQGTTDGEKGPGTSSSSFGPINSPADFTSAVNQIGTAAGSGFSGKYETTSSGLTYSNDCTADFILATDFFVNTALSKEEVEELIKNGAAGGTGALKVLQDNGRATFVGVGDDNSDVTGAINAEGTFQIVYGVYGEVNNYQWSIYKGQFTGDQIEATFQSFIKIDSPDLAGTCSVGASISGRKIEAL